MSSCRVSFISHFSAPCRLDSPYCLEASVQVQKAANVYLSEPEPWIRPFGSSDKKSLNRYAVHCRNIALNDPPLHQKRACPCSQGGGRAGSGQRAASPESVNCGHCNCRSGDIRFQMAVSCVSSSGIQPESVRASVISGCCQHPVSIAWFRDRRIRVRPQKIRIIADKSGYRKPDMEAVLIFSGRIDPKLPDARRRPLKGKQQSLIPGNHLRQFILNIQHCIFKYKIISLPFQNSGKYPGNPLS